MLGVAKRPSDQATKRKIAISATVLSAVVTVVGVLMFFQTTA